MYPYEEIRELRDRIRQTNELISAYETQAAELNRNLELSQNELASMILVKDRKIASLEDRISNKDFTIDILKDEKLSLINENEELKLENQRLRESQSPSVPPDGEKPFELCIPFPPFPLPVFPFLNENNNG